MAWIKTFHLLFVIAWLAGLFYLPRIFVNLAQPQDIPTQVCLLGMAKRLFRFMTILAVPAIALGIYLYSAYGLGRGQLWMHLKWLLVLLLVVYHLYCGQLLKRFQTGRNTYSHRFYRWFNELPVLLLLGILILVIVRPF